MTPRSDALASRPSVRRLVATEARLQRRHHVALGAILLTLPWIPILLALPSDWRPVALSWILLLDVATLGLFVAPALAVVERANGVTAALAITRLPTWLAVGVRVVGLAVWAVVAAAILVVVVRPSGWPGIIAGAGLTSALFASLALVMVGRATTLTRYLARVPFAAAPLFIPALLRGTGLVDAPWQAISPVTSALELLSGQGSLPHTLWLTLGVVVFGALAVRIGFDVSPSPAAAGSLRPKVARVAGPRWWRAWRSFATTDARTLLSDRILVLLVIGVPLVAVLVRFLSTGGVTWLQDQHGVDATDHLPAAWAFVLVLHIPIMVGTLTGMLFLEDRDVGLLPALATTRSSLSALLAYRFTVTAAGAAAFVLVAVPLAGAVHPAGTIGLLTTAVAGAAVATVPAALLAGLARDRIQGTAVMKVMGLPLYAPIAWWFVDGTAGWAFAIAPTAWAARSFLSASTTAAALFALGAIATSAAVVIWPLRRLVRATVA